MDQSGTSSLENFDFFFLRTPTLSIDEFYHTFPEKNILALAIDWWQLPLVKEALWIASDRLYQKLDKLFSAPPTRFNKEQENLLSTFIKYALRMQYRCTPFGTFAGLSVGKVATKTELTFAKNTFQRSIRPDIILLHKMYESLIAQPVFRKQLTYQINNTFYHYQSSWRFLTRQRSENNFLFRVNTKERSDLLKLVVAQTKGQGLTFDQLTQLLQDQGKTKENCERIIHEFIDEQILLPSILPGVNQQNQREELLKLLSLFSTESPAATYANFLLQTDALADQINQNLERDKISIYQNWAPKALLQGMPPLECASKSIQVDLYKQLEAGQIHKNVVTEIKKAVGVLMNLPLQKKNQHLSQFKQRFKQKFGTGEVPFLTLMDEDLGIGFPAGHFLPEEEDELMQGLTFQSKSSPRFEQPKNEAWGNFLLKKYIATVQEQRMVLELSEGELRPYVKSDDLEWSATLYTGAILLAASSAALDQGDFQLFHIKTGGASAARLVGRFYHLNKEIKERIEEMIAEEEPEKDSYITAEIIHTPLAKSGNIGGSGPRNFEIPLFDGVAGEKTLPLSDIMVSVKGNQLLLRSKKWNKWVKPYLTSAINPYFKSGPHFKLLGALANQGLRHHVVWDWGALATLDFLPRVAYGKTILSKARWRLNKDDLKSEGTRKNVDFFASLEQFCQEKNIPQRVILLEGSQQIPLDLKSDFCRKLLWQELKKRKNIVVEENLFESENLFIKDVQGKKYVNEFIFPFKYKKEGQSSGLDLQEYELPLPPRNFNPDAEWLSVHVFSGLSILNKWVLPKLAAFAQQQMAEGKIDQWFFIRYPTPWHHLRIRFHQLKGQPSKELFVALGEVLKELAVWKWEVVPYVRELERYGRLNMTNMEALFHGDSMAVVGLQALLVAGAIKRPIWMIGITGTCLLMDDFSLSLEQRLSLLKYARESFAKEFGVEKRGNKKKLHTKLLTYRAEIDAVIAAPLAGLSQEEQDCFLQRSERNEAIIIQIKKLHATGKLPLSLEKLCGTCIHLFLNRLIPLTPRRYEAVIYDFLYKRYFSLDKR